MSFFGVAGLESIPYSPWLQPILAVVIAINLGSIWLRARATGRMMPFFLATAGALTIILSKTSGFDKAAIGGVLLTMAGSFLSTNYLAADLRRERGSEMKNNSDPRSFAKICG